MSRLSTAGAPDPLATGGDRPAAGRPTRRSRAVGRSALGAAGLSALVGVATGVLWWLLAPGGLRALPDDPLAAVEAAAGQDILLAVCCAAAGGLLGLWTLVATGYAEAVRSPGRGTRAVGRLVGLLLGGAVGGALAWLTGTAVDALVTAAAEAGATGSDAGSAGATSGLAADQLGSRPSWALWAAVLLWPMAVALLVVVDTLRDLLLRPAER